MSFSLTVCLKILDIVTQKEGSPEKRYNYECSSKIVTTSDAQKIVITLQAIDRMLENTLTNDVFEPHIIRSCDLAIVSGIQKTTWVGNDGNEITGDVAGTYTF